jgi:hypothetical protein
MFLVYLSQHNPTKAAKSDMPKRNAMRAAKKDAKRVPIEYGWPPLYFMSLPPLCLHDLFVVSPGAAGILLEGAAEVAAGGF